MLRQGDSLLDPDVRRANDISPALTLLGDESLRFRHRASKGSHPHFFELFPHAELLEHFANSLVQGLRDRSRRARRGHHGKPSNGLELVHAHLRQRRDVRQRRHPPGLPSAKMRRFPAL